MHKPVHRPFTRRGHLLKHVGHVKYMELTILRDLRWDQHLTKFAAKSKQNLDFLPKYRYGKY